MVARDAVDAVEYDHDNAQQDAGEQHQVEQLARARVGLEYDGVQPQPPAALGLAEALRIGGGTPVALTGRAYAFAGS